MELETPIRTETAAAGDRIQGRLSAAIRDASQKVLVPAGAAVEGRVMRAETDYHEPVHFTVALRWETIDAGGARAPLSLLPNRHTEEHGIPSAAVLRRRGVPIELPRPGEERYGVYHLLPFHPSLDKGFKTEWTTDSPEH